MVKTRAIQFEKPDRVVMIELETPEPGPDEVLIRMLANSLCSHAEIRSITSGQAEGYGNSYPMPPGAPGHEGVGEIIAIGDEVLDYAVGDIVVNSGLGGEPTHRSHIIRKACDVAGLSAGRRDPKPASTLEMYGSAYHCIRKVWEQPGAFDNKVLGIIGVGATGLCALQIVRHWPVTEIIAMDISKARLDHAMKCGASDAWQIPEGAGASGSPGYIDIVLECSGSVTGQKLAHSLRPGLIVNLSYCPEPFTVRQSDWLEYGTVIYNPGWLESRELKAVAAMYNRYLIEPDTLITKRIPPIVDEYMIAIHEIEQGKHIKVLMDWEMS